MQIKNLMSEDLVTIDKDQNVSDALKLLDKHHISRLPVLNTNEKHQKELVGIISEKDIADKLGSSKYENMPSTRIHISSVMVKDVIAVPETMDEKEVAEVILENGIDSLPIVEDNRLVGLVTKGDFITLATGRAFEKIPVEEIMSKDITTISPEERLVHGRRLMQDKKVGRLPVMEEGELVGIVTSRDMMRAFIDFKKKVPEKYQKSQIKEVYIDDVMSRNPTSVSPETSVAEVANILMDTGFKGLPVVACGEVVGVVTQTDILRLISELD